MASRSNRPPAFEHNAFAPPLLPPSRRMRPNNRLGDPELVYRVPHVQPDADSSSDDDIHFSKPKPKNRPAQHTRSMSHPFPSLFASKKKKAPGLDDDSSDDDCPKLRRPAVSRTTMVPRKPPRGPADFASGNCMTCGGLVRWPKELDVFRCTICLTINDLTQYVPSQGDGKGPKVPTSISHAYTKTLVREGLRCSLRSFMGSSGHDVTLGAWTGHFPPIAKDFDVFNSSMKYNRSPSTSETHPIFVPNPVFDEYADGSLEPNPLNWSQASSRSHSTSYPDTRSSSIPQRLQRGDLEELDSKRIFKPLEDYLVTSFGSYTCINTSFVTRRSQSFSYRPPADAPKKRTPEPRRGHVPAQNDTLVSELDPKLLLLGDFAENGSWWTGGQQEALPNRSRSVRKDDSQSLVSTRSPRVDWGELMEWYHIVTNAAETWTELYEEALQKDPSKKLSELELQKYESVVLEAQEHLQRVLLKCTEMHLKRPGRLIQEPKDVRFLLLLLANPLLVSTNKSYAGVYQHLSKGKVAAAQAVLDHQEKPVLGRHSGIIKRIVGLLSNSSEQCHHHLVTWFSKLPEHLFLQTKDIVSSFVTYRLSRQNEKKPEPKVDVMAGLIPQMPNNRSGNTPASLHAALEASNSAKKQKRPVEPKRLAYSDDWQIKAAARVMGLLFAANNLTHVRRNEVSVRHAHGHLLATSDFYNTLLDCMDFKADFEIWESRKGKFSFCQYPFFLSIWAKIQILEFDAKRQMAGKAREAFFDSILTNKEYTQYLFLSVRRDCLVEDSLKKVSEVVGSGSEDIKKGLRIEFQGEEGVDAGGLRKEWFLLLIREVFNPDHGLFVFDEDSQYCYFNPHTFETSDQYFLVGVVLGLAIYNSTILDIALPPFAFRKLLAAAPLSSSGASHLRPTMNYTLYDLAEYRPRLAAGLRQLLDFDGDVELTFCLDFAIDVDKYGSRIRVPLCPRGDSKPVTNTNRREYVDLYVRYLLDTSVSRQFEPFKRGFFTVCAGNALSLFRPEEIELLVRGSDEPLDITSLRAVATYTSWEKEGKQSLEPKAEPTIEWFWDTFHTASPKDQRRLLSFITGSDRIPAMGAASLVVMINCLGEDTGRYPTARTCFNVLNLFRYPTQERLEAALWRAVHDSEGFGLK